MKYDKKDIEIINMCRVAAEEHSTCLSRKIGAILTNTKKDKFLSTGVNHPEHYRSCSERNPNGEMVCPRRDCNFESGYGMIICDAVHAEVDAIRNFEEKFLIEGELYMYMSCPIPCLGCSYEIVSHNRRQKQFIFKSGIKRIYCIDSLFKYTNSNEYHFARSYSLLTKNNIELIEIPPENLSF